MPDVHVWDRWPTDPQHGHRNQRQAAQERPGEIPDRHAPPTYPENRQQQGGGTHGRCGYQLTAAFEARLQRTQHGVADGAPQHEERNGEERSEKAVDHESDVRSLTKCA